MESLQQLRFADVIHSILEGTSETKLIEASRVAFGDRIELNRLNDLVQQWKIGDFSALPEITILPGNNLNGAHEEHILLKLIPYTYRRNLSRMRVIRQMLTMFC